MKKYLIGNMKMNQSYAVLEKYFDEIKEIERRLKMSISKIKEIKIREEDGSYSDPIPMGADAKYIDMADGDNAESAIARIKSGYAHYYDNIASMKNDTKLKEGDTAITLGYYEANDGGKGEYIIVDNEQDFDNGSIIRLNNGLYAKLVFPKDNLNIRLNYMGGKKADDRMIVDKLRTLRKALLYSYQAATAVLSDGREFRCLINPDKLKNDYDNKILSIPFRDICLNAEKIHGPTWMGEESTGLQVGDIFTWKETETDWIVYLRHLEEDAYFRAEIRLCNGALDIDGRTYRAYVRGPVETTIKWNQKKGINWNQINYSRVAYIQEDEISSQLKRFDIVQMDGNNWEVQVVNRETASDGILVIYLSEYYNNTIEKELKEEEEIVTNSEIKGDSIVYPYDIKEYTIDIPGGEWKLSNKNAKIIAAEDGYVKIEIITGRAGNIDLIYLQSNGEEIILPITIKSL